MTWTPPGPVVVVEPHADDAYLSLGLHLAAWCRAGCQVTICTVYSGTRHRGRDALAYAHAIGADWVGLGYTEGGGVAAEPTAALSAAEWPAGGQLVLPLGLHHREHVAVAQAAPPGALRYLDQPYASRPGCAELAAAALAGRQVVSYRPATAAKARHAPLFKDQRLFFHRLGDGLTRCFELLVGPDSQP